MSARPYGEIVTAGLVRSAIKGILLGHLAPVLAVVAERQGFDPASVSAPAGYGASANPDEVEALQAMGIIVVPGMSDQPVKRSDGSYELAWDAAVAIVCSARTRDEGQALSEIYGAAVRACILQHRSLAGVAETTVWTDESHEEIAYDTGRSVWAATLVFAVTCRSVVDGYATSAADVPVSSYQFEVGRSV